MAAVPAMITEHDAGPLAGLTGEDNLWHERMAFARTTGLSASMCLLLSGGWWPGPA